MPYKPIAVSLLLILGLCQAAVSAPSQTQRPTMDNVLLQQLLSKLLEQNRLRDQQPIFEEGQKIPTGTFFRIHYKNISSQTLDLGALLKASSIILDGKRYPYQTPEPSLVFLQPGKDEAFSISPENYVPNQKRALLADSLHRWCWVSGITKGEHTLSLQFGGRQYGPVYYYWGGTGPWNVPYE